MIAFGWAVLRKYFDDGGPREAALITYYGFLSLFPALLLGATIVSRVLARSPGLRDDLIAALVPPSLQTDITNSVDMLSRSRWALVAGLAGLAYSGSGVVLSAYFTLNHVAGVPWHRRSGLVSRYLRVFAGLAVILAGALGIGLLTAAGPVGLAASGVLSGATLIVLARLLLDRPAPLRLLWPAALIGALAVTALFALGAAVLPRLVRGAGPVYGSFATVAAVFTLLYLLGNALVIAAEVAAVRAARLWPRSLDPDRPAEADRRAQELLTREQDRSPLAGQQEPRAQPDHPDHPDGGQGQRVRSSGLVADAGDQDRPGQRGAQ
ncbi:YihY/virulence factor BrkB family protein [Paractinoplanes brasiliensis]|uniref:Uncharacterized BrkB/YihY/UPF0761 family membrane protein n=1 Tax=Paractinoplanes brasiliensis TaxID=52695 RepID=A0A4R6J7G4_9ACTN|nr:uncharacterized BrkB/YihY/UPF0761 family membrane protein [Actinoplanes brasiliensis]